jgi:circadian clock protein KaiC
MRADTGIRGLDDVLHGGFPKDRAYLIEGPPGSGKTTLGLQFLLRGVINGAAGLYITLSESDGELRDIAQSHGWDLSRLPIKELLPGEDTLRASSQYTVFQPSELELGDTVQSILNEVDEKQPARVVVDSLSELRLLAQSPLRYRRQILALKQFFAGRNCTVLFLDDGAGNGDIDLHSVVHGVLVLEQLSPEYGPERRRLSMQKLRGATYKGGFHDFRIGTGGLSVFPRLVAAESRGPVDGAMLPSGLKNLDSLLFGGLDHGTSTLLIGPAGSGKSSIALQYALAAAARGEHSSLFLFDESRETLVVRARGLGMPIDEVLASGTVTLRQIDPAEFTPGEFAHLVRESATASERPTRVLVIDSLNGYLQAMPNEKFLHLHLHELLSFLNQHDIVTILVTAQQGLIDPVQSVIDASYLADTVLLFRYVERGGVIKQALSVIKKRSGQHDRTIRELVMSPRGIDVGDRLALAQADEATSAMRMSSDGT